MLHVFGHVVSTAFTKQEELVGRRPDNIKIQLAKDISISGNQQRWNLFFNFYSGDDKSNV